MEQNDRNLVDEYDALQKTKREIEELINELKKYDNKKGYELEYKEVRKKLSDTINMLIIKGETVLDYIRPLLENSDTWSCIFALEIIKNIKSEKSIQILIKFLEDNDDSDNWIANQEAMYALNNIGSPAIIPLIDTIKKYHSKKNSPIYLEGALTGIKSEEVYNFMFEVVKDYINDYKKYDGWFDIRLFIHDFDKQENKDVIPLLEKLLNMEHLSKDEKIEIKDTISIIKDPEGFKKESEKFMKEFIEGGKIQEVENIMKFLDGKKKINKKDFLERAGTPDENFEISFVCKNCKERQNLRTGLIYMDDNNFIFENELMCKKCNSPDIELNEKGKEELIGKNIRILLGKEGGIFPIGKITFENKTMDFEKVEDYALKRIKEEPLNGEIYLRYANFIKKKNKYDEAIKNYEKSLELDSKLIASYINLVQIYYNRYDYYGIRDASQIAIKYFLKLVELFNSHEYDLATIRNEGWILDFMEDFSNKLGLKLDIKEINLHKQKIGRNEPCPCGSGKKYKKCCLDKDKGF